MELPLYPWNHLDRSMEPLGCINGYMTYLTDFKCFYYKNVSRNWQCILGTTLWIYGYCKVLLPVSLVVHIVDSCVMWLRCVALGNVARGALGTIQGLTFYRSKDNKSTCLCYKYKIFYCISSMLSLHDECCTALLLLVVE